MCRVRGFPGDRGRALIFREEEGELVLFSTTTWERLGRRRGCFMERGGREKEEGVIVRMRVKEVRVCCYREEDEEEMEGSHSFGTGGKRRRQMKQGHIFSGD